MHQSKYTQRERSSRLTKLIERHTGSKTKPEKENNSQEPLSHRQVSTKVSSKISSMQSTLDNSEKLNKNMQRQKSTENIQKRQSGIVSNLSKPALSSRLNKVNTLHKSTAIVPFSQ